MLFRNEFHELLIVLKLTKNLEETLKKDNAEGVSLSDKIKSYDKMAKTNSSMENTYEYRKYKRELLGGYYNTLRWIAHERNQMMHQKNYFIFDFLKFTLSIKNAEYYIKNKKKKLLVVLFDILVLLFFLSVCAVIAYNVFKYYDIDLKFDLGSIIMSAMAGFIAFIGIAIFLQALNILNEIRKIFLSVYYRINVFFTNNKFIIFVFLLGVVFYDVKAENVLEFIKIFSKNLCLKELIP